SASGFGDGDHTLQLRASDTYGNRSAPIDADWTVDTALPGEATPPDLTIDSAPLDSGDTTASISFHSDAEDLDRFECLVDNGHWTPCDSPPQLSALALGEHTVLLRVLDTSGNASDPQDVSWTVVSPADTTPPDLTLDSVPSNAIATSATVRFHSTATDLDRF